MRGLGGGARPRQGAIELGEDDRPFESVWQMETLNPKEGRDLPKIRPELQIADTYTGFLGITGSPLTCRRRNCKKAPPLGGGVVKRVLFLGADAVQRPGF